MNHIVVDLEMNTIRKKHPARAIWRQEIIEIGAVLMDELEKIREVMIPTPLGNSIGNMFDFSTLVFE